MYICYRNVLAMLLILTVILLCYMSFWSSTHPRVPDAGFADMSKLIQMSAFVPAIVPVLGSLGAVDTGEAKIKPSSDGYKAARQLVKSPSVEFAFPIVSGYDEPDKDLAVKNIVEPFKKN